eukprot:TRINITY_DN18240_c0_g1_i7.p1 TRINITY_DN18240_c0_g1~~TRINITY_DN18240_c0_g1_i7.p1  ORF type:complete len:262 (+),score=-10.51 TRINITY_DN18240_c0_g1_i7:303-1088(+)
MCKQFQAPNKLDTKNKNIYLQFKQINKLAKYQNQSSFVQTPKFITQNKHDLINLTNYFSLVENTPPLNLISVDHTSVLTNSRFATCLPNYAPIMLAHYMSVYTHNIVVCLSLSFSAVRWLLADVAAASFSSQPRKQSTVAPKTGCCISLHVTQNRCFSSSLQALIRYLANGSVAFKHSHIGSAALRSLLNEYSAVSRKQQQSRHIIKLLYQALEQQMLSILPTQNQRYKTQNKTDNQCLQLLEMQVRKNDCHHQVIDLKKF